MSRDQEDGPGDDLLRVGKAGLEAWAGAAGALAEVASGLDAKAAPETASQDELAALAAALVATQRAFLVAGLTYGQKLAELQARHVAGLGEPLLAALRRDGLDPAARRALIEEARGCLRELAEITTDEARRFAWALGEIDQDLHKMAAGRAAAGGAGAGTAATPRRRWRAKV